MDDLQFLSAGNIDDRVNAALGAKPKSQVNPNNLGNIRQPGQNEGFAQPTSREQGISDIDKNLQAYGSKHGIDTLRGVISRWAPSSENDTEGYVNTVSKRLSLNPDQKIDLADPAVRHMIAAGIMLQEKGPSAIYGAQKQQAQQPKMPSQLDDLTAFTPENIDKRVNEAVVTTDLAEQKAAKQSWAQKHFKTGPVTDIEQVGKKFAAQNNQDFQNAVNTIKGMSIEDWKKNSLIADIGNYYTSAIKGDEKATNAALDSLGGKLKGIGLGLYDVVRHPAEALKNIEKKPLTTAAEIGKATVYDPETLLAGGPAAKLLGRTEKLGVTTAEAAKPALVEVSKATDVPAYLRKQFEAKGGKPAEPVQPTTESALHPEIQQAVNKLNEKGIPVDKEALIRANEAKSLGIDLTEGQSKQDPLLISKERNERGIKEQLVGRFNEQNAALKNKAEEYKAQFAPNTKAIDYVSNSEKAIGAIDEDIKAANKVASQNYEKLKEFGGGKLSVDGQTLGKNAIDKLETEDKIDFVPSTILKKVEKYSKGEKQMNFNLFDNLRTEIANETRKAERAGDGNTVYALSLVRNAMEDLPLAGETAETKALSDTARSSFKALRDLERDNGFYGKAARGGFDSKDFIRSVALGGKNEFFNQAMQIIDRNPQAKENLVQGTLDYMIRESTDGSGNLNPMKMANYIDDLNVNKRLVPLFGEKNANELLKYARVARYTKATPEGSFVNYSNTAPAASQLLKQYGPMAAEAAGTHMGIPFVGTLAKKGSEMMERRSAKKQAEKSLDIKTGIAGNKTKLSDIGK